MEKVLEQIAEATGLPSHLVMGELKGMIEKAGLDAQTMSMDDLRNILAEYLQNVILNAREEFR
ncbi:MAG: hypothetical protein AB7F59_01310 [Bdellovibrionales bacterium]